MEGIEPFNSIKAFSDNGSINGSIDYQSNFCAVRTTEVEIYMALGWRLVGAFERTSADRLLMMAPSQQGNEEVKP